MPTTNQIPTILHEVNQHLADAEKSGIHLRVESSKLDDDWLYVVVVPSRPGVRAADYADFMSRVERDLRKHSYDQVLLVPALTDD